VGGDGDDDDHDHAYVDDYVYDDRYVISYELELHDHCLSVVRLVVDHVHPIL